MPSWKGTREQAAALKHVDDVDCALATRMPVTSGTISVPRDQCSLFFEDSSRQSKKIDFHQATTAQLKELEAACQPATFGRNSEDVLDESYRKAGKLDVNAFATSLPFVTLQNILQMISGVLADDSDHDRVVEAELYKLNTYGVGGFFKAHRDTPRSSAQFGSLVIILPTSHQGGQLAVRHDGQNWTYDFGNLSPGEDGLNPTIGYVAFYSDVEHEVLPVTAGTRVTLTYNLKWARRSNRKSSRPQMLADPAIQRLRTALSALLDDPIVLPYGGVLGFHLQHQYPLDSEMSGSAEALLASQLKGSDRVLHYLCQQLSPKVSIKVYCDMKEDQEEEFLCDGIPELADHDACNGYYEYRHETLKDQVNGVQVLNRDIFGEDAPSYSDWCELEGETLHVTWMGSSPERDECVRKIYWAYGNEMVMQYAYYNACILLHVGEPGERDQV